MNGSSLLLVLDHPYSLASAADVPHERSFSAAAAAAAVRGATAAGHDVDVIDLAADGFDPVMRREDLVAWRTRSGAVDPQVVDYQQRLRHADHLAFVFPIWWEAMPAMTKGFLDRVLAKGVLFDEVPGAKGNPFRNLMPDLRSVSLVTVMTTPHAAYRWWFGDPVTKIVFKGTFGKLGVKRLRWHNLASVTSRSADDRARMLAGVEARFARL
jgi:NAD(P)H dehydrogenase (quinone)